MIKKDLNFLKKYEKENVGTVVIHHSWISVVCQGIQESHKFPEISFDEKICFSLEDFLKVFKSIHGSRHSFIITKEGLEITVKKTGEKEVYLVEKDKDISIYMDEIILNNCIRGTISQVDLMKAKVFEKININMEYIDFLKNPFIILGQSSYIWGTDCIHQLRIDMDMRTKRTQFYKLSGYFKWISEWAENTEDKINVSIDIKERRITFSTTNHFLISQIEALDEGYECMIPIASVKYTPSKNELNQLQCMKIEKMLSMAKTSVKSSLEVYIEIINGVISVNGKPFFTLKNQITIPNKINGYRFAEFIKNSDELILTDKYLQSHNSYLIL